MGGGGGGGGREKRGRMVEGMGKGEWSVVKTEWKGKSESVRKGKRRGKQVEKPEGRKGGFFML